MDELEYDNSKINFKNKLQIDWTPEHEKILKLRVKRKNLIAT